MPPQEKIRLMNQFAVALIGNTNDDKFSCNPHYVYETALEFVAEAERRAKEMAEKSKCLNHHHAISFQCEHITGDGDCINDASSCCQFKGLPK